MLKFTSYSQLKKFEIEKVCDILKTSSQTLSVWRLGYSLYV